jgi:Ca2+/Na+ antiporter
LPYWPPLLNSEKSLFEIGLSFALTFAIRAKSNSFGLKHHIIVPPQLTDLHVSAAFIAIGNSSDEFASQGFAWRN